MKDLKTDFKIIYQKERIMLILMIANFILAVALFIFSFIRLNPDTSVTKVGYGDIGGYRDGSWTDLIAFPLLAILFGVLHNFVAMRIFHKRGAGMTKFFLTVTTLLIIGAFIVFARLTQGA